MSSICSLFSFTCFLMPGDRTLKAFYVRPKCTFFFKDLKAELNSEGGLKDAA